jgi:hypothetical protein
MKTYPKVIGLIMASNEWPLVSLSISHALMRHVDMVYVLKHRCTDGSNEGIERLQALWKDRLRILESHYDQFFQEASMNALLQISQESSPDWFYIFDADEFLLTEGNRPLKQIIADIEPDYSVIDYEIQNWVPNNDFDDKNLEHYRKLRYRSVPNVFHDMDPEVCIDEIAAGNLNFYDLPFPSKVIFRNDPYLWPSAGAHFLKYSSPAPMIALKPTQLCTAHFPFLSRTRLLEKAKQGELLINAGFPKSHGWQSQMTYSFLQDTRLDEFWDSHSIGNNTGKEDRISPSVVIDDRFQKAIDPVLSLLEDSFGPSFEQKTEPDVPVADISNDTQVSFQALIQLSRRYQSLADTIYTERDTILNSESWKLGSSLTSILKRLIPPDSLRYKITNKLLSRTYHSCAGIMERLK